MDAELNLILTSANEKTQYDTYAKRLLSQKCVLAYILTTVMDEFRGMDPKEAERFIEGEIHVGDVPLAPGLTNAEQMKQGKRIVGLNTVQQEIGEGAAVFDILFYARLRDGLSRIIMNLDYSDFLIIPIVSRLFRLCLYSNLKNRNYSCT